MTFPYTNRIRVAGVIAALLTLASCASNPPACPSPQTRNLDSAISSVRSSLDSGCQAHFDRYYDDLLSIAEGRPQAREQTRSSVSSWSGRATRALLSTRQAQEYYNRYFNVKFMSLQKRLQQLLTYLP